MKKEVQYSVIFFSYHFKIHTFIKVYPAAQPIHESNDLKLKHTMSSG
jgi:hypothetical protein